MFLLTSLPSYVVIFGNYIHYVGGYFHLTFPENDFKACQLRLIYNGGRETFKNYYLSGLFQIARLTERTEQQCLRKYLRFEY